MTNPTPEALTRLRQVASAETGAGRMFTLDDAAEIVAYIDRLEALTPSARIMGDKGWENPAEGAHPTSEPLPDAVEDEGREASPAALKAFDDAKARTQSGEWEEGR